MITTPHQESEFYEVPEDKIILDACCSGRMFWFDKENPNALFADIREVDMTCTDGKRLIVNPDVVADFREMPFPDNTFRLVVFDPPHLRDLGDNSIMAQKYGKLAYHWRDDIRAGLKESLRVLKDHGVLIFKWNESEIPIKEVLPLCPQAPLFGHRNGRKDYTIWMTFIKMPIS